LSHEVLLLAAELAQWDTGRRLHESTIHHWGRLGDGSEAAP